MLNLKKIALLVNLIIGLTACSTKDEYCKTSNLESLFQKSLIEHVSNLILKKSHDKAPNASAVINSKVSNVLSLIDIDIENVISLNQQSAKNTAQCTAKIKVSVPPPLLKQVDEYRAQSKQVLFVNYVKELGVENKENSFNQSINYVVTVGKNTDDSEVQFDSYAWENLLSQLVFADIENPSMQGVSSKEEQHVNQPAQTETQQEIITPKPTPVIIEKPIINIQQNNQVNVTGPSFDCTKADKQTDKIICSTPTLAALDVENMTIYKKAKSINPNKTQAIWRESIKYKYACGKEVDCITHIYQKSIKLYGCVAKNLDCQDKIAF